jgi:anti-anti-sigma factor
MMLTCKRPRYTPLRFAKSEVPMARAATKDLKIVISPSHEVVTVTMIGETHFDFDTADKHIREVLKHKPKTVIVDASGLSFISSIGMCFLINLRRAVKEVGASLKLAGLQPLVHKALEHAHVVNMFEIQGASLAKGTA